MRRILISLILFTAPVLADQGKQVVHVRVYDTGLTSANFQKQYSDPISSSLKTSMIGIVTNPYSTHASPETGFAADYVIITIELNEYKTGIPFLHKYLNNLKLSNKCEIQYIKLNKVHIIKVPAA